MDSETLLQQLDEARTSGTLRLDDGDLRSVPPAVRRLRGLRELRLVGCGLETLPGWIGELRDLEVIDLGFNPLRELPEAMTRLPRLRQLSLASTVVEDLSPVARLGGLESLVISGLKLQEIPHWIGDLSRLRLLDVADNQVRQVPDELGGLERLSHLFMWGHWLEAIPDALRGLRSLEVLDLSHRGSHDLREHQEELAPGLSQVIGTQRSQRGDLGALPAWLPDACPSLRVLYAGGQRLTSLPRALPPSLRGLYLAGNEIEAFPPAILELSRLDRLDLRHNRLDAVPAALERLTNLQYLDLADNPLPIPPEILAEPGEPAAILDYIARVRGTSRRLDQAKLLVVGEGSVGKTSLVKRLVSNGFSDGEDKTRGIEVTRWSVGEGETRTDLNIWDFGGQEIMHATHQFFLTRRSLYALVIDARQGEEQNRIEYWLKLIQGFSDSSPVVIVGNKSDQAVLDIDSRGLMAKYPNVVAIVEASCKTGAGIGDVHSVLALAIEKMPHVRDLLPPAFFEVKTELEESEKNYLAYEEYERLCTQHGLVGAESQERLIGFLHDLGTVLCFREDPRLSDTNILNPRWVTGGVYRLLNSHLAAQRKGLLSWADVDEILDSPEYPPGRRSFIVDMMKRFELCYEADGTFLIPDLLTKEEPDTGTWDDALTFEIKYDVLPSSIISRLIVRLHAQISRGTVWRTGLVVAADGNRGLVRGDREDALVKIAVAGPHSGRRELLGVIRTELRAIERTIPGLVGEERVPVPGSDGVWVPYRHLLELESAGRQSVVPQGLTEDCSIRWLLAGIEAPSAERAARREVSEPVGERREPAGAAEAVNEAWEAPDAIRFGGFLVVALVLALAAFVLADVIIGTAAAGAAVGAATFAAVALGAFVLRSAGLLSEAGLIETLKREPPK